LFRIVDVN